MSDEPPVPIAETPEKITKEPILIEQENKKYFLNIEIKDNCISFRVNEEGVFPTVYFSRNLSLKDIQELHKSFYGLNSCQEFLEYIRELAVKEELTIKNNNDNLSINFKVLYLLKTSNIEIILGFEKVEINDTIKDICNEIILMRDKIKNLEDNSDKKTEDENKEQNNKLIEEIKNNQNLRKENKKLVEEIKALKEEVNELKKIKDDLKTINELKSENSIFKEENKYLREELEKLMQIVSPLNYKMRNMYNRSILFDINEFEMVKLEIEKKKGQSVIGLKKIYQATIDGGECSIFHKKCDNIPNTLTVIKSAGYRRFGGFTPAEWDTSGKFKDDKNSFLFSLDKKKIYSYKNNGKAIYCHKDFGPTFGAGYTIKIGGNPLNEKKLYTYEFFPDGCSYNFNNDNSALSESGKGNSSCIYAIDYEVFKVEFY